MRLGPLSCSVMIPSDTGSQAFLVSQLTLCTFLKDPPICSCVQKHPLPWYTQPHTARRPYAPETRENVNVVKALKQGGMLGSPEPRACLPAHPSQLSYALPQEGSAQTLQSLGEKILIFPAFLLRFRGWHANGAAGDSRAGAPKCALNIAQKETSFCHLPPAQVTGGPPHHPRVQSASLLRSIPLPPVLPAATPAGKGHEVPTTAQHQEMMGCTQSTDLGREQDLC